ncbi:MAG: MBL fold metallo-hydrolase [Clostridia bacterium]|nr:MBL fold metallo-hydrolase [Clostridia bacterium]
MMKFSPLFSGSSGNCSVISTGGTTVLIDAGMPGKAIVSALADVGVDPHDISAIVVTHEHSDHIKGIGIISRRFDIPVYANEGTWRAMSPFIGDIAMKNIRTFVTGQNFYIGDIDLTPFRTSHDAAEPVGYSFFHKGRRIVYMTDTGCAPESLRETAAGADLLFLEANHDIDMLKNGPYPYQLKRRILSDKGHLSNAAAGELLNKLYPTGVRRVILAHLSRENNTETIAYNTVRHSLEEGGIAEKDVFLAVAHRDRVTGVFEL